MSAIGYGWRGLSVIYFAAIYSFCPALSVSMYQLFQENVYNVYNSYPNQTDIEILNPINPYFYTFDKDLYHIRYYYSFFTTLAIWATIYLFGGLMWFVEDEFRYKHFHLTVSLPRFIMAAIVLPYISFTVGEIAVFYHSSVLPYYKYDYFMSSFYNRTVLHVPITIMYFLMLEEFGIHSTFRMYIINAI